MIDILSMTAATLLFACAVIDINRRKYLRALLLTAVAAVNLMFVAS